MSQWFHGIFLIYFFYIHWMLKVSSPFHAESPPPTVKQQVDITFEENKKILKDLRFAEKGLKGHHFHA